MLCMDSCQTCAWLHGTLQEDGSGSFSMNDHSPKSANSRAYFIFRCLVHRSGIRASASLEDEIKSTISGSKVVVYSKSWCPFCQRTKALFDSQGIEYTAIELDERDDGAEVQDALLGLTKQRTVPSVFINGQHLGGNDDTQKAAASGKLKEMLGA